MQPSSEGSGGGSPRDSRSEDMYREEAGSPHIWSTSILDTSSYSFLPGQIEIIVPISFTNHSFIWGEMTAPLFPL